MLMFILHVHEAFTRFLDVLDDFDGYQLTYQLYVLCKSWVQLQAGFFINIFCDMRKSLECEIQYLSQR